MPAFNITNSISSGKKVGIIMPAFNAAEYIKYAIDSIINQSYEDYILLVIDDASTDNTWDIIQSYHHNNLFYSRLKSNHGPLKIRNMIFDLIDTTYVAFQDADDWSELDRIKSQVSFLDSNPDIGFCGTGARVFFENINKNIQYPNTHLELIKNLKRGSTKNFCCASIMFRKSLLKSIGKQSDLFEGIGSADIDWSIRALEGSVGHNLNTILYNYRQHVSSFSKINKHKLSSYSMDIAFFTHLLRSSGSEFSNKTIIDFLTNYLSINHVKRSFFFAKVKYYIYSLIPEKISKTLISRARLKRTSIWLKDYKLWLAKQT